MILFAAMLFGFSVCCVVWLAVKHGHFRKLIVQRINAQPNSAPEALVSVSVDSFLKTIKEKRKDITLENIKSDKISQDLFLAGIYDSKVSHLFHLIIKLSAGIPLFLVAFDIINGKFTLSGALVDGLFGLLLFMFVHLMLKAGKEKRQKDILRKLPQVLD